MYTDAELKRVTVQDMTLTWKSMVRKQSGAKQVAVTSDSFFGKVYLRRKT